MQEEVARLAGLPEVRAAFDHFRLQESQFALWQMEVTRVAGASVWRERRGEPGWPIASAISDSPTFTWTRWVTYLAFVPDTATVSSPSALTSTPCSQPLRR